MKNTMIRFAIILGLSAFVSSCATKTGSAVAGAAVYKAADEKKKDEQKEDLAWAKYHKDKKKR